MTPRPLIAALALTAALTACPGKDKETDDTATPNWECVVPAGQTPDFSQRVGCRADFDALASAPLDSSIPGATSMKTVLDRIDSEQYFQNSAKYPIHYEFAAAHLSGNGKPLVAPLSQFNTSEYFSPDRRFVLGAVTWYEGPQQWVWELSPYDTADAALIEKGFRSVSANAYFGGDLAFHPTSLALEEVAKSLPADIDVISTDELFAGIDYQPLNLATSMGQLRFVDAEELDDVGFREVVVLKSVPNDISVVAGLITESFQTPLSHVNVLSQNRGTPNMGLRQAWAHPDLKALDGQWVELTVGAFSWSIRGVTQAEADAWWESNRPKPLDVPPMDTSVVALTDIENVLDLDENTLEDALHIAVPAFGGKASHYSAFAQDPAIPNPKAFAIPVSYFNTFMVENGLWKNLDDLLNDPEVQADRSLRRARLKELRAAIKNGTLNAAFETELLSKLRSEYPGTRMRFRSSTNAEDVNDFNGAGLYTSKSGEIGDPDKPIADAVRKVWASVYSDRAFEERDYYGIEHRNIGMALLVHRSFPDEDANGVAITANIFDSAGLEPAFYINVQEGEASVVKPEPGVSTDQFLLYHQQPGQPSVFLAHSNQIPDGETVLTNAQTQELGSALQAIHDLYRPVYGAQPGFYGMDVEFKFDSSATGNSELTIKQARPYPGRESQQ